MVTHPPINQYVPTLDTIGDKMHAGLRICPQLMRQTINCNVTTAQMATQVLDILDEAGIWLEVKGMSKGKTHAKTGVPHFHGLEMETMLQQRKRLLDVVFRDPSALKAASARFLWQRCDEMVKAWSAKPHITNTDAKKA
jgi:hypothetical protein